MLKGMSEEEADGDAKGTFIKTYVEESIENAYQFFKTLK